MTSVIRGNDNFDTALRIGFGQTWQDLTASRASGVTYTNTSGAPIQVVVVQAGAGGSATLTVVVGGVTIMVASATGPRNIASFIVPVGATYSATVAGSALFSWAELRT